MIIELNGAVRLDLLDVAIQIVHMAYRPTAAVTGEGLQHIGIGDGEPIRFLYLTLQVGISVTRDVVSYVYLYGGLLSQGRA
jgi:hypothetical protein